MRKSRLLGLSAALVLIALPVWTGEANAIQPGRSYLTNDEAIGPHEHLFSPNGKFILAMQSDGNVVLRKRNQKVVWQSNTHVPNSIFRMQGDGNAVIIAPGNKPIWASNTRGIRGSRIELQDDGNLVVYAAGHLARWATGVPAAPPRSPVAGFRKNDATEYARRYAKHPNRAYRQYSGNDCTNFVSQSMRAGGWSFVGGDALLPRHRANSSKWYYHPDKGRTTYTWSSAQQFFEFTRSSRRTMILDSYFELEQGDILQMDYQKDGVLDHSMVVTGITPLGGVSLYTEPTLSYHTDNTLDLPLHVLLERYPNAGYVPHRT